MRNSIILVGLAITLLATSCVSKSKMTYLKYSDQYGKSEALIDQQISVTPEAYKVMPYDNLYIRVLTPDPQWSALFNTDMGSSGLTQESAALSGYTIDAKGDIEIPYVGKLNVVGKSLLEIKAELDSVFKNYVTDGEIMVRLVNNFVTLIGEVRMPGRFILTKDRVTIFDALSLAGDMSEYGDRQKVQLIRPSPYGPVIKEYNLGDRSILASEYYYVMPNDIIYVMPGQGKAFQVNSSVWMLFLTTITSALGIIAFFRTF